MNNWLAAMIWAVAGSTAEAHVLPRASCHEFLQHTSLDGSAYTQGYQTSSEAQAELAYMQAWVHRFEPQQTVTLSMQHDTMSMTALVCHKYPTYTVQQSLDKVYHDATDGGQD